MLSRVKKIPALKSLALLLAASSCSTALAQVQLGNNMVIQQDVQHTLLTKLSETLAASYVDKDTAAVLKRQLREMSNQVSSNKQLSPDEFAEFITRELQKTSGDQHLRVDYSQEPLDIPFSEKVIADFQSDQERDLWRARNLGFEKVERLPFNIGYLQLSAFAPATEAKRMLAASFEFLKNTDSLIIDLRGNFGGFEYTDQLFASYFLEEKTHLFDMHWRNGNKIDQRWSQLNVDGPKYGNKRPVYILTDKRTFSGGESFSYMMKHLGRATVIGETTGGAAHAGEEIQLSKHYSAFRYDF